MKKNKQHLLTDNRLELTEMERFNRNHSINPYLRS